MLATSFSFANADQRSCKKKVICADVVKAKTICADELIVKTGCCACRTITAKDFMDADGNLSQTFVILEPGKYCLGENITFAPAPDASGQPAIQILSNDVHLDLCSNTLRQADKNVFDIYGVQIGEGYNYNDPDNVLKNITITNGSITQFSAIGVFCYNGSFDGPTAQDAFESLTFTDLNVLECGTFPSFDFANGINLDSVAVDALNEPATRVAYKNIIIENCTVNRCLGNGAINVYTGDNVVINNTQANDLSTEISVFGTFAYNLVCRNLHMYTCQGNGTQDLDPEITTNQAGGGNIAGCINVYIKDCQFNDTFGEGNFIVQGANLSYNVSALYENCQFNNTRGGQGIGLFVAGVHASASRDDRQANGSKYINCQFNGARNQSINPFGTSFTRCSGFTTRVNRNLVFENCQACNISSDSEGVQGVAGFEVRNVNQDHLPEFGNVRNVTFINCVASDINGVNDATGFSFQASNANLTGIQSLISNTVFKNCIAERIESSSDSSVTAGIAGFLFDLTDTFGPAVFSQSHNVQINDCRISDVRSTNVAVSPLSAGIVVESVKRPNITGNSVSDCDRGILLTGTDVITPDTLFQLALTFTGAEAFPPVFVDLTSIPTVTPLQSFTNITQSNFIEIAPSTSTISLSRNYLFAPSDLNTLGWQVGDAILYDNNGGEDIGGLISGQTYYLIVYVPGFSKDGVILNNSVDNCTVSGYQDDKPTTSSAWVNNFAFNSGTPASADANYDIAWAGTAPVYAGDLADYPTGSAKAFNISLIQ